MVENDDPFAVPVAEEAPAAEAEQAAPVAEAPVAAEEAPEAPVEPEAPEASDEEAEMVENDAADVFGGMVPMTHPDGGTSDLFEEIEGKLLVPSDMVPTMISHGFVVDA